MDFSGYRKVPEPRRADERYGYLHRVGAFLRRILPMLLLAVAVALMASVVMGLRATFWCYYTDDMGMRRDAEDPHVRFVLWSHPDFAPGDWRQAGAVHGVKFHSDDRRVFVATPAADTNRVDSDLYESEWDGRKWSDPRAMDLFNSPSNEYELVESRDGQWRYFTSDRPGGAGGADIWVAARSGRDWVVVTNLGGVNSASDERGLALSPDGSVLYFASDRPASARGRGGFDIYRARLELPAKVGAFAGDPLPPVAASVEEVAALNSGADELQPELTPRGDTLYFASNRRGGLGGYDIYAARVLNGDPGEPFNLGVEVNTAGDEVAPAVRMEGFDLAFRSNRRQGDRSVVPLHSATCREVVTTVDLTRLENYLAMLNRLKWWALILAAAFAALVYLLKRYRDLTNQFHKCLMASAIAHMAVLVLVATYTISKEVVESLKEPETMEVMVDPRTLKELKAKLDKRMESLAIDESKTMAKISASATMAAVQDKGEVPVAETTPDVEGNGPTIVAKSSDKTLVAVVTPSAASPLQGENMQQLRKMDDVKLASLSDITMEEPPTARGQGEPTGSAAGGTAAGARESDRLVKAAAVQRTVGSQFSKNNDMPVAPVSEAVSVADVLPEDGPGPRFKTVRNVIVSTASDAAPAAVNVPAVASLRGVVTPLDIGVDGILLDTPIELPGAPGGAGTGATGSTTGGVARAGTADGEGFNPGVAQYAVGSGFSRAFSVGRLRHEGGGAGVADVVGYGGTGLGPGTPLRDTGGTMMVASAGGQGRTRVPHMEGQGSVMGTAKGGAGAGDLKFRMPDELDVPAGFMEKNPADLVHWVGRPSPEVVEALGGSDATEGAIRGSLDWFARNQEEDGRWDCKKHGGEDGHDVAATSLALLCYFGWGMKHNEDCEYRKQVKAGLDWLLKAAKEDGDLRNGNTRNGMYDQGIGAMALCEAYGVTRDPALFLAASNAVRFVEKAQGREGGWRYQPGQGGDLSVFGWQFMALHSARLAGVPFNDSTLVKASNWIDWVSSGENGGFYGYDGRDATGGRPSMMAVGMFCRQLQKFAPGHSRMKETATWLRTRPLQGGGHLDFYYLYYTTLALYQHQGEIWEEWNKRMKAILPPLQVKTGTQAGSWDPSGQYGTHMGRAVCTGLGTLSLEVYYRYLPMYGYRGKGE
jgi:hypothetical protein